VAEAMTLHSGIEEVEGQRTPGSRENENIALADQDDRLPPESTELFAAGIFRDAATATTRGQEPRKHHLIPKFYLAKWANNRGQVRVTDFSTAGRKTYLSSTSRAGTTNDFYRLDILQGTELSPVLWEILLSRVEARAKRAIDKLIDGAAFEELSTADAVGLKWFICLQITRGMRWRRLTQWSVEQIERIRQPESMFGLYYHDDDHLTDLDMIRSMEGVRVRPSDFESDQNLLVGFSGTIAAAIYDFIAARQFVVYRTQPFLVTCDEPVVGLSADMAKSEMCQFADSPVFALPLSPDSVLMMFHPSQFPPLRHRATMTHDETVELNRAILGNTESKAFERPEGRYANELYTPELADPRTDINTTGRLTLFKFVIPTRWNGEESSPKFGKHRWWGRPRSEIWHRLSCQRRLAGACQCACPERSIQNYFAQQRPTLSSVSKRTSSESDAMSMVIERIANQIQG
jgi:hypothetical protein